VSGLVGESEYLALVSLVPEEEVEEPVLSRRVSLPSR
jgi:hypothetical protein